MSFMQARLVSLFLLILGLIALAFSIIYTSPILAFIGLGLTFWGTLALYITPEKHVKQTLLDSTTTSSLTNLDQILTELKYQGKAIYLPPKYHKDFETTKIFIPKNKNTKLPTPEEIQREEDKIFLENPRAALITPPGSSLSKLFEKTLGTTFTKMNLEHLQQNLPKLLIEDLEIAEDLEIQTKPANTLHVKITNSIYKDVHEEVDKRSHTWNTIGCPLCSAIACAIAKASGNPVTIKKIKRTNDGKLTEVYYKIIEEK